MINNYVGVLAPIVWEFTTGADRAIAHIADLERTIISSQFYAGVNTLIELNSPANYHVGDELLIGNEYVFVKEIISYTEFVVSSENGALTGSVFKVLKWTIQPVNNEVELDLADTLLNRIPEKIPSFSASQSESSSYRFKLIEGEIYDGLDYPVSFIRNARWSSGPLDKVQFQVSNFAPEVGDILSVEIDTFIWAYTDNQFDGGNLSFISGNRHYLMPGQNINIRGQITNPSYNGPTTVLNVPSLTQVTVTKPFLVSSPAEPGIATYQVRPQFNRRAKVLDVFFDSPNYLVTLDIDIATDDPLYNQAAMSIPVTGRLLDTRFIINPNIDQSDLKIAYYTNKEDLVPTINGVISTIINSKAPIAKSGRTHLAVHLGPSLSWNFIPEFIYSFYDKSNTLLGTFSQAVVDNGNDYFIPVSLDDINPGFSGVKTYKVESNTGVPLVDNLVEFEVLDCSEYSEYNLIWKDSQGSYLSFPFDMKSNEIYDSIRDTYYTNLEETYNVETWINWQLSTNWIKEEWNYLFKDMMLSPIHLLKKPDGEVIRVTLLTDQIEWKTRENDGVINYNIVVRQAKKLFKR